MGDGGGRHGELSEFEVMYPPDTILIIYRFLIMVTGGGKEGGRSKGTLLGAMACGL